MIRKATMWAVMAGTLTAGSAIPMVASAQDDGVESVIPTAEGDRDLFWADNRSTRVLMRRLFETDGRLDLTLYFGATPNDAFQHYFPIGLRVGYHLSESVGLELSGSYLLRAETELATFIDTEYGGQVDVLDQQQWRANMMFMWSPIYGKFSFIGRKLAHFDWYFGAGMGVVSTTSILEDRTGEETVIKPEGVLGTGWRIWLSDMFALRVDYRQFLFEKVSGGVTTPSEISIGFSVLF